MADITEALPFVLARAQASAAFTASGVKPDITIGDMPFFLAVSDQYPYDRKTADSRRQQIDTSREPGEQTLSQWWVRDQDSWHRGAGINYYEPGTDARTQYRYASSYGIDPWTQGQIQLHRKMDQAFTGAGNNYVTGAVVSGADVIFKVQGNVLARWDGTTATTYTGGSPVTEPVIAGTKVLSGSTSGIHVGDVTGSTLTTLWTTASGVIIRPWWAKSRIIASKNEALFDLTMAGGNIDTATPLYTHPTAGFTWTAVADAPGAILAAGYANGYGYIYSFGLNDSGSTGVPVLGNAVQVAEFPPGEEVHALRVYLSSYVAIGTAKGVRIGFVDGSGVLAYGPIVVSTTKPVRAFSARDTYIFAGIEADINGNSGCARIDLSESISDLRFPWAYDVQIPTPATVQSVSFFGLSDRVVIGASGQGVWRSSATNYETSGTITSGWIRYGTSEPKLFNRIKVRTTIPGTSSVTIATIDTASAQQNIVTLGSTFSTDQDITLKSIEDKPQANARIALTLTAGDSGTTTPIVQSFQVKATPTPTIQREISVPLRLYDKEQDSQGVPVGYVGYAYDRMIALEAIEEQRSVVIVKDYTNGESFSAQIREVRLIRTTPPQRNLPNYGGLLYVTMLKL